MTDAKIRLALFYLYLREAYTRRKQMTFKNYDDFVGLLETCNFKVAEADFSKPVETPFIAYFKDEDKNVYADGKVIFTLYSKIDIELYTDRTDQAKKNLQNGLIAIILFGKRLTERGLRQKKCVYHIMK